VIGLTAGLVFFVGTCHWIANVLRQYGGLSLIGAVLLFALLAVYLSLFFSLFAWTFAKLSNRHAVLCLWLAPAVWVATEYLRAHLNTGFPWCLLGYALVDAVDLAQFATLTGVYGLSFLLMTVNSTLSALLLRFSRVAFYHFLGVIAGVLSLTGLLALRRPELSTGHHSVRIVQANINLDQKWDLESKHSTLVELSQLSCLRLAATPDSQSEKVHLILWPETPAPFYYNHDSEFRSRMQEIAVSAGSHFLFGFVDFRSTPGHQDPNPYNSVALLGPHGELISQYDKIHLVPFGEYVPYTNLFFFVEKISTEAGNFKPGTRIVVSPLGPNRRLGTFICYEAVVPDLIRQFARDGAQVFVNVTNDAWFGESPAPFQHLAMARMRAIENRRYLLRAANNGISAVVDPYGRIVTTLERNQRKLLDSAFDFETMLTTYARHGDVFAWTCLAVTGVSLLGAIPRGEVKLPEVRPWC
jgi:apolipoprotein N-acyltransferase